MRLQSCANLPELLLLPLPPPPPLCRAPPMYLQLKWWEGVRNMKGPVIVMQLRTSSQGIGGF
jgi:hypothetical protein